MFNVYTISAFNFRQKAGHCFRLVEKFNDILLTRYTDPAMSVISYKKYQIFNEIVEEVSKLTAAHEFADVTKCVANLTAIINDPYNSQLLVNNTKPPKPKPLEI